jgi:hypothetical protein
LLTNADVRVILVIVMLTLLPKLTANIEPLSVEAITGDRLKG